MQMATYEKVFSNKIPCQISENDIYPKTKSPALQSGQKKKKKTVEMSCSASMECRINISHKIRIELPYDPGILLLWHIVHLFSTFQCFLMFFL